MLLNDNFLVYPSLESAAKSFLKLYEYGETVKGLRER